VDAGGKQVKLNLVSWSGTQTQDFVVGGLKSQPIAGIIRQIVSMGFNGVRLPWSEQMWQSNPVVSTRLLTANRQFIGKHARTIFDAVVQDLAAAGLMVMLDNQSSEAGGCCSSSGDTLWYTPAYPESQWLADWKAMAAAFRNLPQVIGADLRSDPRGAATWGGSPADDWHAAAERGGDAVLSADPRMLIFVEGTDGGTDLSGAGSQPVILSAPGRLVYSVRSSSSAVTSYDRWASTIQGRWGYLVGSEPLLVGEFGTCSSADTCVDSANPAQPGDWFTIFMRYLATHNLGSAYWALNGLLNNRWSGVALPPLLSALQAAQPSCPAGPLTDGTYYISNVRSHDDIDIPDFTSKQGTGLIQWIPNNRVNQRWQVTRLTCDLYSIRSVMDGESLDIRGQSTAPGARVDQRSYSALGSQQFLITQNAAGDYSITSVNSLEPVEVPGPATRKGTLLDQSGATGGANQQWRFIPV
jgi:endoglucanase